MTEKLSFELSHADLPAPRLPEAGVPAAAPPPEHLRRRRAPSLPRLSEPEIMRHYSRLAFAQLLDLGAVLPARGCTMKYNPVVNEQVVGMPGFAALHPTSRRTQSRARSSCCGAWSRR